MDINHLPVRQCIGCRLVRPKHELLRFIKASSGTVSFDIGGSMRGRGFYLCPNVKCLREAWRNKRTNAIYLQKSGDIGNLIQEVRDIILKDIEKSLIICEKMGYLADIPQDDNSIREDDLVIEHQDNPPEEKVLLHTSVGIRSENSFLLPTLGRAMRRCSISGRDNPILFRLKMNLQKYEMLSFKGLAK